MELKDLLDEGKGLIWINSDDPYEVHDLIEKATKNIENKKIYEYQEYKTIDFETKESIEDLELLNSALEELYPLGLRKKDIFLMITNASKELEKKKNIELLKEIYEIKEENKDYKFITIIFSKTIPEELKELFTLVNIASETKDNLKSYLLSYSETKNLDLNIDDINQILQNFKSVLIREHEKRKGGFINVEGGKVYIPLETDYFSEGSNNFTIQEICDLEVLKFPVTDSLTNEERIAPWNLNDNLDTPVSCNYGYAIGYCNFLSKIHGYREVYKFLEHELYIVYANGEEVHESLADYSKTEGYRLPRFVEYYWFATGGRKSNLRTLGKDKTLKELNQYYEEIKDQLGWFNSNPKNKMVVCKKKANELGIFDIIGNIDEYLIDTSIAISKDCNEYGVFFTKNIDNRVGIIEKSKRVYFSSTLTFPSCQDSPYANDKRPLPHGFRVVRTMFPKI